MTLRKIVGTVRGVTIEVAAWDGAGADVDLSCVCMFAREIGGGPPKGGLAHVNAALDGHLVELRDDGCFRALAGKTLLIDRPPRPIAAKSLLILGLGEPVSWTSQSLVPAVHLAASTALNLDMGSVAFAPSMLDSGLLPDQTRCAPASMVEGLIAALHTNNRLQELGLTRRPALQHWIFDVGAERFEDAAGQFRAMLQAAQ